MQNTTQTLPETFLIWNDEIENRFDPFFYRPIFKELLNVITNNKTEKIILKDVIINSIAGDWGEDPTDFEPNIDYELCYVIRNTNFHNDFNLDFSDVAQRYIKKSKIKRLALKKGDILIEKSGGSPIQPVGRVALVDNLSFDKPVVFSNFLQKMEINKELILPEYVFVYLQVLYKAGYMDFIQNQTTGIKNLRLEDFFNIQIIKPDTAKQKEIASKAIEGRMKQKNLLEKAKIILASIDNFVLGELGIEIEKEKEEMAFEINSDDIEGRFDPFFYKPNFKKLRAVLLKTNGIKFGQLMVSFVNGLDYREFEENGNNYYLRVGNIRPHVIIYDNVKKIKLNILDIKKKIILRKNDLLLTRKGTYGVAVALSNDYDNTIISSEIFLIRLNNKLINPHYVEAILNSKIGKLQFEQNKVGAIMGSLSQEAVRNILIPLPKYARQQKIADGVDVLYEQAKILREEAESLTIVVNNKVEKLIFPVVVK